MKLSAYTQGAIWKHLVVMSGSLSVGWISIHLSNLVDIYLLSLLGDVNVTAAIGFASPITFFIFTTCIALMFTAGALVALPAGTEELPVIRKTVFDCYFTSLVFSVPLTIVVVLLLPFLLTVMGAEGLSHDYAYQFLVINALNIPILALVMTSNGIMRAVGDGKGAMIISLIGGGVNALLDPIFIFVLDMGIKGAAIATILSQFAMMAYGYYNVIYKKKLLGNPREILKGYIPFANYWPIFRLYISRAFPILLTNVATPFGMAVVTYAMAQFSVSAVAANAIIIRLLPVFFVLLFELASVSGPIAAQNLGARNHNRVMETLSKSTQLVIIYGLIVCGLLFVTQSVFVPIFGLEGEGRDLLYLFCNGLSLTFMFNGFTIIANSYFNYLGAPHYSTIFNLLRLSLGIVPFVYFGAKWGGAPGVLWGQFAGFLVFGLIALAFAARFAVNLKSKIDAEIEAESSNANTNVNTNATANAV